MCRVLQVSRSGYYAWKIRPVCIQATQRTELVSAIHVIHADREMHAYGSPRIYRELLKRGYEVCENTVAKLMSSEGDRINDCEEISCIDDGFTTFFASCREHSGPRLHGRRPGPEGCFGFNLHRDGGRISVSGVHDRCVFAACNRLVDEP